MSPSGNSRVFFVSTDAVFSEFRADPDANPLQTPSGKIEIYSETIAGFGETDCPGHPTWLAPVQAPSSQTIAP